MAFVRKKRRKVAIEVHRVYPSSTAVTGALVVGTGTTRTRDDDAASGNEAEEDTSLSYEECVVRILAPAKANAGSNGNVAVSSKKKMRKSGAANANVLQHHMPQLNLNKQGTKKKKPKNGIGPVVVQAGEGFAPTMTEDDEEREEGVEVELAAKRHFGQGVGLGLGSDGDDDDDDAEADSLFIPEEYLDDDDDAEEAVVDDEADGHENGKFESSASLSTSFWRAKYKFPIKALKLVGMPHKNRVTVEYSTPIGATKRRDLLFESPSEAADFYHLFEHERSKEPARAEKKLRVVLGGGLGDNSDSNDGGGNEKITFLVEIVSGWGLPAGDRTTSDPYVKCSLDGVPVHQTKFIPKT